MHPDLTELSVSKYGKPTDPKVSDQRERIEQNAPQAQSPGRSVLRLFIGIPLAAATTSDIVVEVHRLQSSSRNHAASDNTRWSAPESWHITLQFLGRTTPEQYDCVVAHLRVLHRAPIPVQLGPVGTFPRVGVLLVGVQVTTGLLALQQAVTAATSQCGFIPEQRPYHPHITIARRKGKGKGRDRDFRNLQLHTDPPPRFASFTADSFVLYESIPTREGSRYEIRERFSLDGSSSG
jgi:RNA 2',3'-cyclic 3'-phosphodiesterase